MSDEFSRLLGLKTEEARASMAAKLNETIFGTSPIATWKSMVEGPLTFSTSPHWRDARVAPPLTMKGMSEMFTFIDEVQQPISYVVSPAMYDYMKNRQQGGKEVSDHEIVNSVINERKKVTATKVIEQLEAYFGQFNIEQGLSVFWTVRFNDSDNKEYSYAAVRGERKWYITRDSSEYTTTELIAHMAVLAMRGNLYTGDGKLDLDPS